MSRLLFSSALLCALAALGPPAEGTETDWSGICEVKVVECPLMIFEAVREAGGGGGGANLPGELSAAQVEMLWKAVGEKKATVVLSAELAAAAGRRSEWRLGKIHRYLGGYDVERGEVTSTVEELALGWTVALTPHRSYGAGGTHVVEAQVSSSELAEAGAAVATPHGPIETPSVLTRSVTTSARVPASGVAVLGLIPAGKEPGGAAGPAVQVVLLRTQLPGLRPEPRPVPQSTVRRQQQQALRRTPRQARPAVIPASRQSFVSVKVLELPDALLDAIRSEAGESAAGSEITPDQLGRIAAAVKSGKARILHAAAVGAFAGCGGQVLSGGTRRVVSGYDLAPVHVEGAEKNPVMIAEPVVDEVFSGFSAKVTETGAVRRPAARELVLAGGRSAPMQIECASETGPLEVRSVDGPHGKVQLAAVEEARVRATLARGSRGAYLLGGSTGAGAKGGAKRVVLVEVDSE